MVKSKTQTLKKLNLNIWMNMFQGNKFNHRISIIENKIN